MGCVVARASRGLSAIENQEAQVRFSGPQVGFTNVVEACPPLLLEIAAFAVTTPQELFALALSNRCVADLIELAGEALWSQMYLQRWPAFHDCLKFKGASGWARLYAETYAGCLETTLEIYDREKKLGFAMSAMAARVQYDASRKSYVARYLSASEVQPEIVPEEENYRLRFCPVSARERLKPGFPLPSESDDARMELRELSILNIDDLSPTNSERSAMKLDTVPEAYPYRVLEGVPQGLAVGQGVELQWKMQFGSPFGWWFGTLESLHISPDGKLASASIVFPHFPSTSRWYRLRVQFGDEHMRPCAFGGFTGGIRPTDEDEHKQWMLFFPKELVVF